MDLLKPKNVYINHMYLESGDQVILNGTFPLVTGRDILQLVYPRIREYVAFLGCECTLIKKDNNKRSVKMIPC